MVEFLTFICLGVLSLLIVNGGKKINAIPGFKQNTEVYDFNIPYQDFERTVSHVLFHYTPEARAYRNAPAILRTNWWQIINRVEDAVFARFNAVEPPLQLIVSFDEIRREVKFEWTGGEGSVFRDDILRFTIDEIRIALAPHIVEPVMLSGPSTKMLSAHREDRIARRESIREWPSPQDYNEAIQTPAVNFDLPLLKGAAVSVNEHGLPRPQSGAFASVYKMKTGEAEFAVKCFLSLVYDQEDRYGRISQFVLGDDLPYTVDFDFLSKGILIRSRWYPILRMNWVDGLQLHEFIGAAIDDRQDLEDLADKFLEMVRDLASAGIAHGDLQHGNIMVCDEGLRLVDYDGMFVPGMEGWASNEIGHRNYQHPKRNAADFGPWLDNFSALVIYTSIRALAADPSLWTRFNGGDECLILRQADFNNVDESVALKAIADIGEEKLRALIDALRSACAASVATVPHLDELIGKSS